MLGRSKETLRDKGLNDGDKLEGINQPKHETIILAICVNGHENEIRPEALDSIWYFKCTVCGTLYVQISRVSTQEIKGGLEHGPENED